MREQLVRNFNQAYTERIKLAIENGESKYLSEVLSEIIERLNSLIPNRKDLHQQLKQNVDVELIEQMIDNRAFDSKVLSDIIGSLLTRITLLSAPADKPKIERVRKDMEEISTESWAEAVAPFFLKINQLIDVIERRLKLARENPFLKALITRSEELRRERMQMG